MKNIRTVPQLLVRVFVRPIFPLLQWLMFSIGAMKPPTKRYPFVVGVLKGGVSFKDATRHLKAWGFFPSRITYIEPGQVLSLRRLDEARPILEYHIRIFEDREVRGHYEYTPEDRPIEHMKEAVMEERRDEFIAWLNPLLDEKLR